MKAAAKHGRTSNTNTDVFDWDDGHPLAVHRDKPMNELTIDGGDDSDDDDTDTRTLSIGAALQSVSGSDIYTSQHGSKQQQQQQQSRWLFLLPGLLSLHPPPPMTAAAVATAPKQRTHSALNDRCHDETNQKHDTVTLPKTLSLPSSAAAALTPQPRPVLGRVQGLLTDSPVLTLGTTGSDRPAHVTDTTATALVQFPGRHMESSSSTFVVLRIVPDQRQRHSNTASGNSTNSNGVGGAASRRPTPSSGITMTTMGNRKQQRRPKVVVQGVFRQVTVFGTATVTATDTTATSGTTTLAAATVHDDIPGTTVPLSKNDDENVQCRAFHHYGGSSRTVDGGSWGRRSTDWKSNKRPTSRRTKQLEAAVVPLKRPESSDDDNDDDNDTDEVTVPWPTLVRRTPRSNRSSRSNIPHDQRHQRIEKDSEHNSDDDSAEDTDDEYQPPPPVSTTASRQMKRRTPVGGNLIVPADRQKSVVNGGDQHERVDTTTPLHDGVSTLILQSHDRSDGRKEENVSDCDGSHSDKNNNAVESVVSNAASIRTTRRAAAATPRDSLDITTFDSTCNDNNRKPREATTPEHRRMRSPTKPAPNSDGASVTSNQATTFASTNADDSTPQMTVSKRPSSRQRAKAAPSEVKDSVLVTATASRNETTTRDVDETSLSDASDDNATVSSPKQTTLRKRKSVTKSLKDDMYSSNGTPSEPSFRLERWTDDQATDEESDATPMIRNIDAARKRIRSFKSTPPSCLEVLGDSGTTSSSRLSQTPPSRITTTSTTLSSTRRESNVLQTTTLPKQQSSPLRLPQPRRRRTPIKAISQAAVLDVHDDKLAFLGGDD